MWIWIANVSTTDDGHEYKREPCPVCQRKQNLEMCSLCTNPLVNIV